MPIYEYVCKECHRPFEALVMGSRQPECPHCHSRDLEQQLSAFSVSVPSGAKTAACGAPAGSCAPGGGG
jgi:putative FmdB family regulatory protein